MELDLKFYQMKTLINILSIFFVVTLIGCDKKENNIFWISEPDGQKNDLLFMAESTNILPLGSDSLMFYLTKDEFLSAEKLTFKNYGKIYENERFKVHVLLKIGSDSGRDYTFIVRTFNHDSKIIDSYNLAEWIDLEKRYCFGSINDNLIIKRSCADGNEKNVRQITNDGRIVASSKHGRE